MVSSIVYKVEYNVYQVEFSDPISLAGNIRPHVISLLFRSLVSIPLQAVNAAHDALSDVLTLSGSPKLEEVEESSTSQSRLPKELLQTCLRPVLLNLREYTKLSVPLLRGLSRLLSLLSTWFNKTLGEKLLDHLRKWTEPGRILSLNIWKEGEEPIVAAAIVSIFSSLPQAAMFVEPLVKTCIKLESTILSFKARFLSSPYRLPLARYLNKHAQYTVSFFFPRLKSPMYSELFQHIIQLEESLALREYLSNKQCSVMLLNVCFERPLSIIRSEKTASSGGFAKSSLMLHGIGQQPVDSYDGGRAVQRPMTIETLEVQHQGFRLVGTLLANNPDYFCNHNDIVRAFRWLWRSKGRCLRLQHEEIVAPRFHNESKMLAYFLMSYVKSFTSEDLDILFELFRVFLQPSTSDFAFVSRFLVKMVTSVLSLEQKRKVIQRFFASIAGDTNEEIKVLGIQFLVFPMMAEDCRRRSNSISSNPTPGCFSGQTSTNLSEFEADTDRKKSSLMDDGVIKKFANEVIFLEGSPVNYGDRLKVELLRLLYLFVEFNAPAISPFKNELVKYCWGLLKSEDMPCKCWAYVVVCRFIASFEIPEKIIRQVYASVLRFSQLENKELVRSALDLLVPALPTRLSHSDFSLFMENTCQLIADEGSSLQTLTHVGQIIIRYSSIFQSHCVRFVAPLISCIHRLGLSAPGTDENRCIAMSIVELLLQWHRTQDDMARLLDGRSETICNFLIQFKIITADGLSDQRHPTKVDTSATGLDARITESLEASLALWNPKISSAPIEKCIAKPIKGKGPLRACLEIISMAVEFKKFAFLSLNSSLVQRIIVLTVDHARDDMVMQGHLRLFVSNVKTMSSLTSHMLVALEKVVEESKSDKKTGSLERNSDRARGKERSSGNDDGSVVSVFTLFCLELIADLFRINSGTVNYVATTLLSVAKSLSKAHLAETATRQRQGSSVAARSSSTGIRHRTPTIGILEEAHLRGQSSVLKAMKSRSGKDEPSLSTQLRCIVVILSVFEDSDLVYTFTQDRKSLLEIIHGILESSDNVQLLMAAIRCVGKWMTSKQSCSPFTVKERNDLLIRISNFDLCNLPDDIISHPLADLVSAMVLRLRNSSSINDCDEFRRLAAACLLHTNSVVREEIQGIVFSQDFDEDSISAHTYYTRLLSSALGADYEALSARFWIVCIVDFLMRQLATDKSDGILDSLRVLAHGNISVCQKLSKLLFSFAWNAIQDNQLRVKLILLMESLLAKTYHAQLHQTGSTSTDTCSFNSVRMFLNIISCLNPIPLIDTHLLTYVAENYNCWYEVISLLEKQYLVMTPEASSHVAIAAMRHCYRHLGEDDIWRCLALESCVLPKTKVSISLDVYDLLEEAANEYAGLMSTDEAELDPTDFEMDLWEERWVMLQKELCQVQVVSEFARVSEVPSLQLECAWKAQDWSTVRSLCSSAALLSAIEKGDPMVKLSETLLAVADGKLSDVENLHAQTAQLCLYKWQLLPRLSSGSHSHASLLHIFHRLVEVRESGQIMVETSKHSNGRTLPDLKNLLSAWRYRLPNDWEKISIWDEVFAWRAHMFSAITSNFHWCEPDMLATQHDRPWTALRMAKSARKQGIRDVARLLLHKATEEQAMNVSDAYVKLREQILTYLNPESKLELTGGLSLIEATNLSFFDESQKSELFRLKALFLQSLQSRSKANQAFCHSVQICPTHARAWDSWGELCASLGTVTEKQREQSGAGGNGTEGSKDVAKKVRQYLAQAMGCYLEAIQIDGHEWARIRIPKCLWMLTKDGSTPGVLCQTLETRGAQLPAWVWLPWIPQLLTSLYRREGQAIKSILTRIVKIYPQAVYYPLRAFYLERRDVDRVKSSTTTSSPPSQGSVARAEELMSLLRRSHASLWSALESCLEELIVTFRPSYEEELLATLIVLLERAESQIGSIGKKDDEQAIVSSVWKTLGKIAVKFFRTTESSTTPNDARVEKTALFKNSYKTEFELDFLVSANEESSVTPPETSIHRSLDDVIAMLRRWKVRLEDHVLAYPESTSLIDASNSLAMFGVGDSPDLWPGSCDPSSSSSKTTERESMYDTDASTTQTSTSSSAAAARKAAKSATQSASEAAMREGIGGDYGGGSSWIEIPGQYIPNTSSFTDVRPSPELHAKLIKFESSVSILRRSDTLVRRIGMASSDGKTYHFLLQFAVPYLTRTDERNSQTHFVLDKVLRKSVRSSRALLAAQSHPVIPVAQRLRLVSEPVRRTSLDEIHRQVCLQKQMDHSKLSKHFNDEVKRILNEKSEIEELEESDRAQVEKSVRLEVFSNVCNSDEVDDMMLMDHLLSTLHGPERLYQFRRVFSQQWACNCLLQYVFSVLERTPSKVVFDFCSGRVLAPEFRIAYTNQGCFERQPTPFRLSPNLATLIGFPILNSRFVVSMATIAGAVKSCHQDLDPIFRLLMRDDLVAFYTKSVAKSDAKTFEMEKQLSGSVSRNVAALHSKFSECAPTGTPKIGNEKEIELLDQKVRDLVTAARNPENLCLMSGNYQGWL